MTTTKLVARVVVVHTDEGKQLLQIKRAVNTPMLEVADSAGNEYLVQADDYERASATECAQFYAAKAEATLASIVTWN